MYYIPMQQYSDSVQLNCSLFINGRNMCFQHFFNDFLSLNNNLYRPDSRIPCVFAILQEKNLVNPLRTGLNYRPWPSSQLSGSLCRTQVLIIRDFATMCTCRHYYATCTHNYMHMYALCGYTCQPAQWHLSSCGYSRHQGVNIAAFLLEFYSK